MYLPNIIKINLQLNDNDSQPCPTKSYLKLNSAESPKPIYYYVGICIHICLTQINDEKVVIRKHKHSLGLVQSLNLM